METTTIVREETAYWPLFGNAIAMTTATVEFDVPGDGVTTMTFSHREDDPEGMWLADSRIGPNGFPVFVHGAGDRTCSKQIAGPEIVASILGWEG
jgi:hypothetical protein